LSSEGTAQGALGLAKRRSVSFLREPGIRDSDWRRIQDLNVVKCALILIDNVDSPIYNQ